YVTLIFCILLIGCEKYKNYDDCYLSEIQKFKYEPSHNDRTTVAISCEIKYPYEKEIYGVEISWHEATLSIKGGDSLYDVTKVIVLASEDDCDSDPKFDKRITYLVPDGKRGHALNRNPSLKCYKPNATRYWGVISKSKVNASR